MTMSSSTYLCADFSGIDWMIMQFRLMLLNQITFKSSQKPINQIKQNWAKMFFCWSTLKILCDGPDLYPIYVAVTTRIG